MNWYQIFYWITVADGVKSFFDVFSNIFTIFASVSLVVYVILMFTEISAEYESEKKEFGIWKRHFRTIFLWTLLGTCIFWAGYMFTPTKKDAMIIVAGGAIGNFITSDSSAKQIPAELTLLVREKLKSEVQDIKSGNIFQEDTLKDKTKEQLLEIIKNK